MLGWQSQKTCNTWKINWKSFFFLENEACINFYATCIKKFSWKRCSATILGLKKDFPSIWRNFAISTDCFQDRWRFLRQFDVIFVLQRGSSQFDEFLQPKNLSLVCKLISRNFSKTHNFYWNHTVFQLSVKILGRFLHKFWG